MAGLAAAKRWLAMREQRCKRRDHLRKLIVKAVAGDDELQRFEAMGEKWMPRSMVNDKRIARMFNNLTQGTQGSCSVEIGSGRGIGSKKEEVRGEQRVLIMGGLALSQSWKLASVLRVRQLILWVKVKQKQSKRKTMQPRKLD